MQGYAAVQTGIETRIKIFKTKEEAVDQVQSWLGEAFVSILTEDSIEMAHKYLDSLEVYKEDGELYVYDKEFEESTEIVEVEIPE